MLLTGASSDEKLMLQIQKGNRQAFQKLYERYKAPLMSYFMKMIQDSQKAEDMFQDLFVKIYKAAPGYQKKEAKLSTWIWTIARNLCIDYYRSRSKAELDSTSAVENFELEGFQKNELDPERLLLGHESLEEVNKIVSLLPEKQRECLLLRILGDLSYAEISEIQDCSVETVKVSIFRAKKSLEKHLRKEAS